MCVPNIRKRSIKPRMNDKKRYKIPLGGRRKRIQEAFGCIFSKYLIYRLLFDSKIGENAFPLFFLGEKEAGLYFRSVTGPARAGGMD
jgi:hypothetical protein